MMTRQELADRYAEKTGADLSRLDFYHVFALFKSVGVLQQIYYRYHQGLTKDERFANLIYGVHVLAQNAARIIERSKL
jgi:aminoglycoside phosphotransferase (APT) family kinase protein